MWRKEGTAHDPKHTTSSVKNGGGSAMAWACMAATELAHVFIDEVLNAKEYRNILSNQMHQN